MLISTFYLTYPGAIGAVEELTDLSRDEIEQIVGRFRATHHKWANCLKGEVYVYFDGSVEIRHHFNKQILWSSNE